MKKLFWIAPVLVLAACDAPTTTSAPAGDGVTPKAGEVRGTYDPTVSSRDAVIDQIIAQCGGSYDHVWETPIAGGKVGYTARCS